MERRTASSSTFSLIGTTTLLPTTSRRLHTRYPAGSDSNDFRNGYLRIELFNWGFLTPVSLATLASYCIISSPPLFESLNGWAGFWSEFCAVSKECTIAYNRFVAAHTALCASVLSHLLLISFLIDDFDSEKKSLLELLVSVAICLSAV
jgi:hypothetical protein